MATNQSIAVLGAGGTMGFPIAQNLARSGFTVRAWNRTREKAEPLRDDGAEVVDTPAEAVRDVDVVITILADADAVVDAIAGAAERLCPGVAWIQMSTIGDAGTDRCIELAHAHSLSFIDAPVLGTKQPAHDAKLVVLASGPDEMREQCTPIFDAIGQRAMWVGEAGAGSRLKLVTNSWILAIVEGTAETLALAEGMGLDPQLLLEAVGGGPLDLPYLQMKGRTIIEGDFEPSFKLALAAKDAGLVDDAADRNGLDLPLLRTIRRRLTEGARQYGNEDMSATYKLSAPAGVTG